MLLTVFAAIGVDAEPAPSPHAMFEAVWVRSECNQRLDQSLNNARYHELGGGFSLGMVLCWLGPSSESHLVFLVAPRTGGRPQLLRFEEWRNERFAPTDVLTMAEYHPETKTITSYRRYSGGGVCGGAGEWAWTGREFKMTGYWEKPDCGDDSEFDRSDRFRVYPPKK
jgi:hypothetical protein